MPLRSGALMLEKKPPMSGIAGISMLLMSGAENEGMSTSGFSNFGAENEGISMSGFSNFGAVNLGVSGTSTFGMEKEDVSNFGMSGAFIELRSGASNFGNEKDGLSGASN